MLLVGSTLPWYEAWCVAAGAARCVTLEYNALRYDHPAVETITVAEWDALRAARAGVGGDGGGGGEAPRVPLEYDAVWSISSFEHDGLGRCGGGDARARPRGRRAEKGFPEKRASRAAPRRYGDALNPDADLEAMARARDWIAPGGRMYLAVPVGARTRSRAGRG